MLELDQDMKIYKLQEHHIYYKRWLLKELLEDQKLNLLKKLEILELYIALIQTENSLHMVLKY